MRLHFDGNLSSIEFSDPSSRNGVSARSHGGNVALGALAQHQRLFDAGFAEFQ